MTRMMSKLAALYDQPNREAKHWWTRLSLETLAWLHFKAALAVWALAYAVWTPAATTTILSIFVIGLWILFTVAGSVISMTGLIFGEQTSAHSRVRGAQFELSGIGLMFVGPFIYFTTQLSIVIGTPSDDRIGLVFFSWAMVAAVSARFIAVRKKYRRALREFTVPTTESDSNP